jgi:hypothetical protein
LRRPSSGGRLAEGGNFDARYAAFGIGLQHALEHPYESLARDSTKRGAHIDSEPPVGQIFGLLSGEHGHGGRPHRIHVGRGLSAPLKLFGRHVAKRPDHGAPPFRPHPVTHSAEVDESE